MAISISNLTSGANSGSITSQDTASISPTSNALILVAIMSRRGDSTEPTAPSLSGNGLTWVKITETYFDSSSSSRKKLSLFRAMGASPSSGVITISFGAETQTDVLWVIDQVTGADTSGTNGSGAVGGAAGTNIATNKQDPGSGGAIEATLGAFSSTNNATYGAFSNDTTINRTIGSGFTELAFSQQFSNSNCVLTEWKSTNDTSVDATFDSNAGACSGVIAIEINAATTNKVGSMFMMFQ
jgi:hypothetical protein